MKRSRSGNPYVGIVTDTLYTVSEVYDEMYTIYNVPLQYAMLSDFQRLFKCDAIEPGFRSDMGMCNSAELEFPKNCSSPPCDFCGKGK